MGKIQDYINNVHKYKIDETYQRPVDAWSNEDNQCFIDTILKGEPVPLFFANYLSDSDTYYIVDGQQRLNAINQFYNNRIKLNGKFSGEENNNKTFNGENPINDQQRSDFLSYDLSFKLLEDYNDERIRMIFSRLQRGKPLQLGERLNAKPGKIVELMREIANHPFMSKSIGIYKGRYGNYPDAARILFYEKYGAKQSGSTELYNFFDKYYDMSKSDNTFKNAINILNYLKSCFPPEPGDYKFLEKHAWVIAVYSMVRELKLMYSMQGKEKAILEFIKSFHSKVYSEDFRKSNSNYQRFYDNVRGGWSEKIIAVRRDILLREFLKKENLEELSDKRQISDEEKIEAFSHQSECSMCHNSFKDYKEAEYHHIKRYTDAGPTEVSNILVLCPQCHIRIHGNGELELPSEEEKIEDDI